MNTGNSNSITGSAAPATGAAPTGPQSGGVGTMDLDRFSFPPIGESFEGIIKDIKGPLSVHTEKFGDREAIDLVVEIPERSTRETVRVFLPKGGKITPQTNLWKLLKATGCLTPVATGARWYECVKGKTVHITYNEYGFARLLVV